MTTLRVIMWLATFLNLAACALNAWSYIRSKRLNKEIEDALDEHKRAAERMPKVHIVHLINEQPEVKVARAEEPEIKEEDNIE